MQDALWTLQWGGGVVRVGSVEWYKHNCWQIGDATSFLHLHAVNLDLPGCIFWTETPTFFYFIYFSAAGIKFMSFPDYSLEILILHNPSEAQRINCP